ncbi:hypothetical protein [Novosphingobium sp. Fuku2-ISO-50]|uniref:hypothetical protein n=1 Tax=Novosphingobium sp. Fuku2-ISO-50 TaxID=1739114 RepID=UPI00076D1430|nr:hypothetical protein [Novosphingobium sp. Fuku2-ISO-50]KUR77802.1 hypothetical protein AQZ50_09585 [Novosphingobium sp. Fuku2-ISO-50]
MSKRLGLPTASLNAGEAAAHFGWLAGFVGTDMAASGAVTREMRGWEPKGPGLMTAALAKA